jgi:hypothetical protein
LQKTAYLFEKLYKKQESLQKTASPVICKACQVGNQSSAVTPVICNLYQAGKSLL